MGSFPLWSQASESFLRFYQKKRKNHVGLKYVRKCLINTAGEAKTIKGRRELLINANPCILALEDLMEGLVCYGGYIIRFFDVLLLGCSEFFFPHYCPLLKLALMARCPGIGAQEGIEILSASFEEYRAKGEDIEMSIEMPIRCLSGGAV